MRFTRRRLIISGLLGGLAPVAATAQSRRGPLGLAIPEELLPLVPDSALDLVHTVETLLALEREAEVRGLPHSLLELARGGALPTDLEALYSAALPRLVALIDRATAGRRDGGIGERAGALLARLHAGERDVAELWRPRQEAAWLGAGSPLACQVEQVSVPVVQALPEVAELPEEPPVPEEAPLPAPVGAPSRATRYADLAEEYAAFFAAATIREERRETAQWHLTMLRQSRAKYAAVAARTGVPWFFIGATHGLEASFNFRGHLHNGDHPLSQRTRQVPANRPAVWLPPSDWESSAVDAMRLMGFAGQDDWSLPRTLYRLEAYNGFGYRRRGVPTPYLWSFSNHYERGKFVADGRWSATARSQQCGAAVMLKLLVEAGEVEFA